MIQAPIGPAEAHGLLDPDGSTSIEAFKIAFLSDAEARVGAAGRSCCCPPS
jgi:hypothetical protein